MHGVKRINVYEDELFKICKMNICKIRKTYIHNVICQQND
jgi:hypothetical protein